MAYYRCIVTAPSAGSVAADGGIAVRISVCGRNNPGSNGSHGRGYISLYIVGPGSLGLGKLAPLVSYCNMLVDLSLLVLQFFFLQLHAIAFALGTFCFDCEHAAAVNCRKENRCSYSI